jgi:hypothetical protein
MMIYPLNMAMGPWPLLSCDFSDIGYCPKFHVQRFYVMDLFQEKLPCFTNKNIFTEIFVQRAVFEITVDHIMPTSSPRFLCINAVKRQRNLGLDVGMMWSTVISNTAL